MNLRDFLTESNRIEGEGPPNTNEHLAAREFLAHQDAPELALLKGYVFQAAPHAVLRDRVGLNVRVGSHIAPTGGLQVVNALRLLLGRAKSEHPYDIHVEYETLHPFTDGNGRSGRLLWLWGMRHHDLPVAPMGFLQTFYYQTLERSRP